MNNIPEVKIGLVTVSRSAFPLSLADKRKAAVMEAADKRNLVLYSCPVTVESEVDMLKALDWLKENDVNALVVFLGNFGPETPETLIAKKFDGPAMFCAAAEEDLGVLKEDRGDAYCGMLNCSYNMDLRNVTGNIPGYPVGDADEIVTMIEKFIPVARAVIGVKNLKIITFGPRPEEFFACNAPVKQLYDMGAAVSENSELDLFKAFEAHKGDERIPSVMKEMCEELNLSSPGPRMDIMAQYELTLLDLAEELRGSARYVAFANKCWPAFEDYFGFVPCYVNSRLTAKGIPVACEVDIYGALSEFIGTCIVQDAVTILDINNSVPKEQYEQFVKGKYNYRNTELFMGFHCGVTPSCKLTDPNLHYHVIMARDTDQKEDYMGTMEGSLQPGGVTFFRLHGTADGRTIAYVAQGEVLPVSPQSFGSIGIVAIPEMERFYRNVLLEKHYPHHAAVAFSKIGRSLWEVFRMLGVTDVSFNQPANMLYPHENPYEYDD